MHYVVCLAEEGNVTRAARRLNIVQPALSMHIAKLEESLGQKLFERSVQGVRLTPAGARMVELVTPILRDAERARQAMRQVGDSVVGRVSIGLVTSVAQCTLAKSTATIAARYPQVHLCVSEGYSESLIDWVAAGQLETALVNVPRQRLLLNTTPVLEEEMVLVRRKGGLPLPPRLGLAHLSDYDLVLPSKRHGLRTILEGFAAAQGLDLRPRLELDNIGALCEVVATTDFVTVLPSIAVHKEIIAGNVEAYRFTNPPVTRSVAVVQHPRRPLSAAGRAVLDIIRHDLQDAAEAAAQLLRPNAPARRSKRNRPRSP